MSNKKKEEQEKKIETSRSICRGIEGKIGG